MIWSILTSFCKIFNKRNCENQTSTVSWPQFCRWNFACGSCRDLGLVPRRREICAPQTHRQRPAPGSVAKRGLLDILDVELAELGSTWWKVKFLRCWMACLFGAWMINLTTWWLVGLLVACCLIVLSSSEIQCLKVLVQRSIVHVLICWGTENCSQRADVSAQEETWLQVHAKIREFAQPKPRQHIRSICSTWTLSDGIKSTILCKLGRLEHSSCECHLVKIVPEAGFSCLIFSSMSWTEILTIEMWRKQCLQHNWLFLWHIWHASNRWTHSRMDPPGWQISNGFWAERTSRKHLLS